MPRSQSKDWCFTLNNPSPAEVDLIKQLFETDRVQYGIYGHEVAPTTGTPHLQGFIRFASNQRFNAVRGILNNRWNVRVANGTPSQNRDYCVKDGDFHEVGECPVSQQGKRNDLERLFEWSDAFEAEHGRAPTSPEIAKEQPAAYVKYPRFARACDRRAKPVALFTGEQALREWQDELHQELEDPGDDRKIKFVVDDTGGKGKSWFVRWMYHKYPDEVQVLGIGKKVDLAYMVDVTKRIFFFNVPRTQMEFLQYGLLEELKDRLVLSTKYQSTLKTLHYVPHVVVFSNEYPDMNKLSADRYDVVEL